MRTSSWTVAGQPARILASFLIFTLVQNPAGLLGEGAFSRHKKVVLPSGQLSGDERSLHALNRLTFGPQPGDLQRVNAIGLEKWVDLQLNPEKIDDSLLAAQLRNYPIMQMPLPQMVAAFPSAALIRNAAEGKRALPADRIERAIYQNQIFDYQQRKERQAQEAAALQSAPEGPGGEPQAQPASQPLAPPSSGAGAANQPGTDGKGEAIADAMALEDVASSPSIQVHEQKLYADLASTAIVNLPPDQRWNRLINMTPEQFRNFVRSLTPEERLQVTQGMSPQQKEAIFALVNPTLVVAGELLQTRLLTDIYSKRQLQAVMVDFWLNHFNVYLRKGPFAPWYLIDYERNAIAPNAMGKFEDLLVATAKSPAMLFYLDNQTSIGPDSLAATRARMNPNFKNRDIGLNENYARELMELHTLGVDGGYTQKDVTEVAKVFTGWTINEPGKDPGFTFNPRRHEPGPKYVLGRTIQENGEKEGLDVLHMLATSPATARHISQQLAVRFVSDNPPPALVDRMTKTYLATSGEIREVLRTMLDSPEFWSKDVYRAKVKTPEEFVVSAVRATGGEVVRPAALLNAMNQLGMPFYGCQTPNGYSWKAEAWVNTGDLLDRMNLSLALAAHRLGTMTDLDALLRMDGRNSTTSNPSTVDQKEQDLEEILLNRALAPQMRNAVLQQLADGAGITPAGFPAQPPANQPPGKNAGAARQAALVQMIDLAAPIPPPADKQTAVLAGLLLGSPEFQKR